MVSEYLVLYCKKDSLTNEIRCYTTKPNDACFELKINDTLCYALYGTDSTKSSGLMCKIPNDEHLYYVYKEKLVSVKIKNVKCSNLTTWILTDKNELYGCGLNKVGCQGSGTTDNVLTFTKRAENVKDFKCSGGTTWYINFDNELFGCGSNFFYQQDNTKKDVLTFTKRAENVKDFMVFATATGYINFENELYVCGANSRNAIGVSGGSYVKDFTKVAENVKSFIDYKSDHLESYNGNYNYVGLVGALFYINNDNDLYGAYSDSVPRKYASNVKYAFDRETSIDNSSKYPYIDVSYITNDNEFFEIRYRSYDSYNPVKLAENVKEIAGYSQKFYIDENDDLYGKGSNDMGQQGDGTTTTVKTFTKRAENVKKVSCAFSVTAYLNDDGELYAAGALYSYSPGKILSISKTFKKVCENVRDFYLNHGQIWAISNDDELFGIGINVYGQQGNGTTDTVSLINDTLVKKNF